MDDEGELPHGVFVSYDHAMFRTKAFEQLPDPWGKQNQDKIEDRSAAIC